MKLNIRSAVTLDRIYASGDIEPPSPFDTTGSEFYAHYQRGAHSSLLRERKIAWDPSSSISHVDNEAGTGTYSGDKRPSSIRNKFGVYNQSTTLATTVERMFETVSVGILNH